MYQYKEIKNVHLEITDKCNAACPQCARNDFGGQINPRLPLVELSLEQIKNIFPRNFVSQLNSIYACGNYGDAIVAKDTLEIFQYFRSCSPTIKLTLYTNGSARSTSWWQALAQVLKLEHGEVIFGLDGLEDTNHIYRRNTNWSVIMRNVESFIATGGNAHWFFIVFRHNEHQIEAARQLADKLGFRSFKVQKTNRFSDPSNLDSKARTPIKNNKGEIIDWLEAPVNPERYDYKNRPHPRDAEKKFGSMQSYLDQIHIDCKAVKDKSIYVSASGHVLPCCYLATHLFNDGLPDAHRQILPILANMGGLDRINANKESLGNIIQEPFFQKHLPESWEKPSFTAGKIHTCSSVCGKIP